MITISIAAANIATAILVGSIVFQSFIVAPTVFHRLENPQAGRLLRALFPRFYLLGLLCGLVLLLGVGSVGISQGWSAQTKWLLSAAVFMTALQLFSLWLVPHINAARDAGIAGQGRFQRLHGLSVLLTILVLILGVGVLVVLTNAGVMPTGT